ncbi:MAG: nucleotidyl transferase AbiEii/AbiGii toxin family protein [Candidatus Omnitrophota bacterium]
MLTYDSLIEQAKVRQMPTSKVRGILREYLQVLVLKELYKQTKSLFFTGGTYLRLVHNLKRFSEDLDFNASNMDRVLFEGILKKIKIELERVGIKLALEFGHWDNIYVSKLIFPDIEKSYNVISKYSQKSGIIIKVETNNPKWEIKPDTQLISAFGELYPCICTEKGALFADKIDALNKKNRARHIYDIMFMLSNKYPINIDVLRALGIKSNPLDSIIKRIEDFSNDELKKQAETLRPFLFEETEADLIVNAKQTIPLLIEKYSIKPKF